MMNATYNQLASNVFLTNNTKIIEIEYRNATSRMANIELAKIRGLDVEFSLENLEVSDEDARLIEVNCKLKNGWLDQHNDFISDELETLEIREINLSALLLSPVYEKETVHFLMMLLGNTVGHALNFMFDDCDFATNSSYFRAIENQLCLDVFALDDEQFSSKLF
jgi:hypothetical protein